jgi:hypothetical protein
MNITAGHFTSADDCMQSGVENMTCSFRRDLSIMACAQFWSSCASNEFIRDTYDPSVQGCVLIAQKSSTFCETPQPTKSTLPWWAWLLIALGILIVIIIIIVCIVSNRKEEIDYSVYTIDVTNLPKNKISKSSKKAMSKH